VDVESDVIIVLDRISINLVVAEAMGISEMSPIAKNERICCRLIGKRDTWIVSLTDHTNLV
jgi:hypothetical protein